jgi:hypothetical protein
MRRGGTKGCFWAAWRRKAALLRYRACRQAASLRLVLKTTRNWVYIWPPFGPGDDSELDVIESKWRYYLNNLDIAVKYFRRDVQGTLIRHRFDMEQGRVIESSVTTQDLALDELQRARYCALWKHQGQPRASSLWPHLYYLAEGPVSHGTVDWLRLVSDVYLSQRSLPLRTVQFPRVSVESCAVLGTGPSVDDFVLESGRWDAWIGSNFLVCDEQIRRAGRAFACCAMDPYAFSDTDSFENWRECLFKFVRETSAVFVTLADFAPFIELNFPEDVKAKCLYAKVLGHDTYRATSRFTTAGLTVTPYGNVLTDLMLPLATSVSRRIILYGCDGKPPNAATYPKGNSMQEYENAVLREVPGALDDFSGYIDALSLYTGFVVQECKKKGVEITLRRPSWNLGLRNLPVLSLP